jgi:hypothetical protein
VTGMIFGKREKYTYKDHIRYEDTLREAKTENILDILKYKTSLCEDTLKDVTTQPKLNKILKYNTN